MEKGCLTLIFSKPKDSSVKIDTDCQHQRREVADLILNKLGESVSNISKTDFVAVSFSLVASGQIQGLIHTCIKIWKMIAGLLLIHEGGGKVTDFKSRLIKFNLIHHTTYEIIAANRKIHPQLLKIVN